MADIDAYLTGGGDSSSPSSDRGPVNDHDVALDDAVVDYSSVFWTGPPPIFNFTPITLVRTGIASLRITFDEITKQVAPAASNDALNPVNYAVSGPTFNDVVSAVSVAGDPFSIDLYLSSALIPGTWTVNVSNVVGKTGQILIQNLLSVIVVDLTAQGPLAGGATNYDMCNVLLRFLNPALRGKNWDDLICSIAIGDRLVADNARLAFDQLYLSTAKGRYLTRKAGEFGQKRPPNVGMSDENFRKLAITASADKLTQEAMLEVLEIFYGKNAVSASIISGASAPFVLADNDTLRVLVDEKEDVTVTFKRTDFSLLGGATAEEVAAVITRTFLEVGSQAIALAVTDTLTGLDHVVVYSGRRGLGSSIKIVGGRAQTSLLFPQSLFVTSGVSPFAEWAITPSPSTTDYMRFTLTSGIYDLNVLHEGDLVYIYGLDFETSSNNGVFEVKEVSVSYDPGLIQWFEVENVNGDPAVVSQERFEDLMFFRPVRKTISDTSGHVVVAQTGPSIDVVMPATTLAVGRGPGTGSYLNVRDELVPFSVERTGSTVLVSFSDTDHGLQVGDLIFVDLAEPTVIQDGGIWGVVMPVVVAGTPSPDFVANAAVGVTNRSERSTLSEAHTVQIVDHKAVRTPEGLVVVMGGETKASGVSTTVASPIIFEITGTSTTDDGRRDNYKWTKLVAHTQTIGRRDFGMSVLADGRVVATGGHNSTDVLVVAAVDAWDILNYANAPAQDEMVSGVMLSDRAAHGQCTLLDDSVLVSGGWAVTWDAGLNTVATFNTSTFTWTAVAPMLFVRVQHELATMTSGKVLAIGGRVSLANPNTLNGTCLHTCEVYDPNLDTWTRTGNLSDARFAFGSVVLPDGRVLVVGGIGYNPTRSSTALPLKSCELYDPSTGFWTHLGDLAVARAWPTCTYVPALNSIVVTGGDTGVETLDLDTMTWRKSTASLGTNLSRSRGVRAADDVLLVVGGTNDLGDTEKTNFVMVPGDETFWEGGINTEAVIATVPISTQFTYETPDHMGYTLLENTIVTPVKALAAPASVPGPFAFDPRNGIAVTENESELVTNLEKDQRYSSIELTDATMFPDAPGYLAFQFGFENVVFPVKYLGRLSTTAIALDASFKFPCDVEPGSSVCLLASRTPFQPSPAAHLGGLYATDSASGRIAAEAALDETVAAGMNLQKTIVYPGDRGLGGEGKPASGANKLSDKVAVWGGNDLDTEYAKLRAVE